MQNKQAYIDFILDCFNKGVVERGEVMAMFGKKWQTPPRTFDRYFKQAKEAYSEQREVINKAKLEESIAQEKEAVKRDIMGVNEAKEILTKMARGIGRSMNGRLFYPTDAERRAAIDLLAKMSGWHSAEKQEIKIENGSITDEDLMNSYYCPEQKKWLKIDNN